MEAVILSIFTKQENVQTVNTLNAYQLALYNAHSKAIRKCNTENYYKDYTSAYTETYLRVYVYKKCCLIDIPIRSILERLTNKHRFTQNYLDNLLDKLNKNVNVQDAQKEYKILDLEILLENALK